MVTSRIRLGTMVTSPNFRHPVPLAKDLLSIDDISMGRLIVGVGSGGLGADATVLGDSAWSLRERTDRFEEFVGLLDQLLRNTETSSKGSFYSSREARMLPGTIQQPRTTLLVAANGERGMRLAAKYGEGWITLGRAADEAKSCFDVVNLQSANLDEILEGMGRSRQEATHDLGSIIIGELHSCNPARSFLLVEQAVASVEGRLVTSGHAYVRHDILNKGGPDAETVYRPHGLASCSSDN